MSWSLLHFWFAVGAGAAGRESARLCHDPLAIIGIYHINRRTSKVSTPDNDQMCTT